MSDYEINLEVKRKVFQHIGNQTSEGLMDFLQSVWKEGYPELTGKCIQLTLDPTNPEVTKAYAWIVREVGLEKLGSELIDELEYFEGFWEDAFKEFSPLNLFEKFTKLEKPIYTEFFANRLDVEGSGGGDVKNFDLPTRPKT